MERIPIESSKNIASIGYDANAEILEIEFLNNSVYQYFDIPEQMYAELMKAESQGKYLAENIKGVYGYAKV